MADKPRVRFCWQCGYKLQGNHFKEIEVDGHMRICHKTCAKDIEDGVSWPDVEDNGMEYPDGPWARGRIGMKTNIEATSNADLDAMTKDQLREEHSRLTGLIVNGLIDRNIENRSVAEMDKRADLIYTKLGLEALFNDKK